MPSSLEIAQRAELQPVEEIAAQVGLEPSEIEPYGRYKAKVTLEALERRAQVADGKLVCVTGMTPTRAGEGKTTTSVALTQGLGAIGRCEWSRWASGGAPTAIPARPASTSRRPRR